ncbi:MAG: tRNA (guanosine(37)-N1)-methyltransferase TrmD [Candidatus Zambryskibacteria bacterium RIFCSPHIGHO2_01_FULL_44_22b]|uniref:tRNA (guanine-N(1)-)-methyltransferase n=2 Tax=Candidatus Zambryskiibacteriota TaxID=1817925 RepID=A0A1G2T133_9BACT|nr:MAG: tRNA (guanosine(37)-N1)-methyltransferase TrmD [Candidatus Zambryskibacteria bacterium RIFCSPHIGHO2_01_FULL_44_22b]OHB04512.1 MAG: tRNA (guanosine(37)-N1)-methyltransferase TrmD [Candidatus Zambryskibacteria bacterium RIFCSPLOWO2_01_FULL_45_43]
MQFDIVTIFPRLFESFKNEALIARAQKKKIISINAHNLRDFAEDKRGTVDDRPYGGGVGMVLLFKPIYQAVKKIRSKNLKKKIWVIAFGPKGKKFTQDVAKRWSKYDQLVMICGRYEGIDERVIKNVADEEVSIGDYVLFGGEVPAMVVMEAVTRLLPGAIAKQKSLEDESFKVPEFLEYPHFTRPEVIVVGGKKLRVPKVLLSGHQAKIEEWKRKKA